MNKTTKLAILKAALRNVQNATTDEDLLIKERVEWTLAGLKLTPEALLALDLDLRSLANPEPAGVEG